MWKFADLNRDHFAAFHVAHLKVVIWLGEIDRGILHIGRHQSVHRPLTFRRLSGRNKECPSMNAMLQILYIVAIPSIDPNTLLLDKHFPWTPATLDSLRLEKKDCTMANVEVDEMFRLCCMLAHHPARFLEQRRLTMRHEASEVSTDYTMPC